MKFNDVVAGIGTITDLRRTASAYVVDHKQLRDDELRAAIIKVKPQYLHRESVQAKLNRILYQEERKDYRVLVRVILIDILLEQYGFSLPFAQTEEKTGYNNVAKTSGTSIIWPELQPGGYKITIKAFDLQNTLIGIGSDWFTIVSG